MGTEYLVLGCLHGPRALHGKPCRVCHSSPSESDLWQTLTEQLSSLPQEAGVSSCPLRALSLLGGRGGGDLTHPTLTPLLSSPQMVSWSHQQKRCRESAATL